MRNLQRLLKIQSLSIVTVLSLLTGAILFALPKAEQDTQWTAVTHDRTNFPLIGKHRTVECRECHVNLVFEGTPNSCEACHWERRQDDRYQLRLGSHCADCHTPLEWKRVPPNKWNHATETGFAREGIHRTLDCVDCHGDQEFHSGRIDCFSCHEEDYREVREPDHVAAGFPLQCQICHRGNSRWEGADFSHDFFVLRGQHRLTLCSSCHIDGQFAGLPKECFSCHAQDYNTTQDPDHLYLGFPTDCVLCHGDGSNAWDNAKFTHNFFTLRGEHLSARCSECHVGGQFVGLSRECITCHQAEYQNAKEPDHEAAGFPADCAVCHGRQYNSWEGAKFDHSAFVLKGQHKQASCSECHSDGVYKGRSTACASCHLDDYNSTSDPNHKQLGFPTNCESCHGDKALTWDDADFSHDVFVLRGQHTLATCSDCHTSGSTDIPSACASCHLDDYNSTSDPNHKQLGFPTNCESCHGDKALTWDDADFSHDVFVLRGQHTLDNLLRLSYQRQHRYFLCLCELSSG